MTHIPPSLLRSAHESNASIAAAPGDDPYLLGQHETAPEGHVVLAWWSMLNGYVKAAEADLLPGEDAYVVAVADVERTLR